VSRVRQWFLLIKLAILLAFSSAVAASPRKLTEAEAQKLALLALRPNARKLPGLRFDSYAGFPGRVGFYWFEITAEVPDNASPILGHYAVNEATGDVWEPAGGPGLGDGSKLR
jgi:hypothetical protein